MAVIPSGGKRKKMVFKCSPNYHYTESYRYLVPVIKRNRTGKYLLKPFLSYCLTQDGGLHLEHEEAAVGHYGACFCRGCICPEYRTKGHGVYRFCHPG